MEDMILFILFIAALCVLLLFGEGVRYMLETRKKAKHNRRLAARRDLRSAAHAWTGYQSLDDIPVGKDYAWMETDERRRNGK